MPLVVLVPELLGCRLAVVLIAEVAGVLVCVWPALGEGDDVVDHLGHTHNALSEAHLALVLAAHHAPVALLDCRSTAKTGCRPPQWEAVIAVF